LEIDFGLIEKFPSVIFSLPSSTRQFQIVLDAVIRLVRDNSFVDCIPLGTKKWLNSGKPKTLSSLSI